MTTYFWHQSDKITGEDVLLKNNTEVTDRHEKADVFKFLNCKSTKLKQCTWIFNEITAYNNRNGLKINPSLKFKVGGFFNKWIFIQSHCFPKDDCNRNPRETDRRSIAFMFYIDNGDMGLACSELEKYYKQLGLNYSKVELEKMIPLSNHKTIN